VEYAGQGTDKVESTVSYTLTANVENLDLIGFAAAGTGNDLANRITGNAQDNTLNGRGSADILTGGGGHDTFVFDTALGRGNVDILSDFNPVDDIIVLESAVFTALGDVVRVLYADEFKTIKAGTPVMVDSSDRIIYNWNTGSVFYDPDGIGASPVVEFAQVGAAQNLTNADFVVM
jgi:Ca2+-binding RTX toxin-like protein